MIFYSKPISWFIHFGSAEIKLDFSGDQNFVHEVGSIHFNNFYKFVISDIDGQE